MYTGRRTHAQKEKEKGESGDREKALHITTVMGLGWARRERKGYAPNKSSNYTYDLGLLHKCIGTTQLGKS